MTFITYLFIMQLEAKSYNQIIIGNLRKKKQVNIYIIKTTKARLSLIKVSVPDHVAIKQC